MYNPGADTSTIREDLKTHDACAGLTDADLRGANLLTGWSVVDGRLVRS